MLSKKSYYALKALLALGKANATQNNPMLIKSIIQTNHFPRKFIEAILVDLKQTGIVSSKMGKGGGYYLSKSPEDIKIGSIIRTLDGPLALIPCVSKTAYEMCSHCGNENICSIRLLFKEVRDKTAELLDNTSLKTLMDQEKSLELIHSKGLHYVI